MHLTRHEQAGDGRPSLALAANNMLASSGARITPIGIWMIIVGTDRERSYVWRGCGIRDERERKRCMPLSCLLGVRCVCFCVRVYAHVHVHVHALCVHAFVYARVHVNGMSACACACAC